MRSIYMGPALYCVEKKRTFSKQIKRCYKCATSYHFQGDGDFCTFCGEKKQDTHIAVEGVPYCNWNTILGTNIRPMTSNGHYNSDEYTTVLGVHPSAQVVGHRKFRCSIDLGEEIYCAPASIDCVRELEWFEHTFLKETNVVRNYFKDVGSVKLQWLVCNVTCV